MTTPDPNTLALNIEIDHSAYYRWVPIPEADVYDDSAPDAAAETPNQVPRSRTVDSSFPGFRMTRVVVPEPTTSTCSVHLADLARWNDEREAAGLSRRPDALNLIQHLADGPWPKHFPLDSITAIRADDPTWAAQLTSGFVPAAAPAPVSAPAPAAAPEATQ